MLPGIQSPCSKRELFHLHEIPINNARSVEQTLSTKKHNFVENSYNLHNVKNIPPNKNENDDFAENSCKFTRKEQQDKSDTTLRVAETSSAAEENTVCDYDTQQNEVKGDQLHPECIEERCKDKIPENLSYSGNELV